MPSLIDVGGYVSVQSNSVMEQVDMPELRAVGSYLQIYSCASVEQVSLEALLTVGSYLRVYYSGNSGTTRRLTTGAGASQLVVNMPVLRDIGSNVDLCACDPIALWRAS